MVPELSHLPPTASGRRSAGAEWSNFILRATRIGHGSKRNLICLQPQAGRQNTEANRPNFEDIVKLADSN